MKRELFLTALVGASLLVAQRAGAAETSAQLLEVDQEDTLAYEEPSNDSPVLRRLYLGELVRAAERVFDPNGKPWIKVEIGSASAGFVPESRLAKAGDLPASRRRPTRIVRDERPLGVGVRGLGETLGATLNLRYLPLTRLGFTLGVGAVLDRQSMRGRSFSAGLVCHPLLGRLSPFIEAGLTSLAYDDGVSTLNVLATYATVGLEVMVDWGLFVAAGASFIRSVDTQISYSWHDAHSDGARPGTFGRMGSMMDGDIFQTIQPSLTLGYGF